VLGVQVASLLVLQWLFRTLCTGGGESKYLELIHEEVKGQISGSDSGVKNVRSFLTVIGS
jgi:hypothetical protein